MAIPNSSVLGILFRQQRVVIGSSDVGSARNLQSFLRQTIGGVVGIVVDASVAEEHVIENDVTENPVEDGAKITDHVQLKPAKLTIQGVITDYPFGFAVISNIQNIVNTVGNIFGQGSRSIDAFNALLKLRESRQPFTVVTSLKKYDNLVFESLSVPRSAQTGNAIHFTAVLKQIRIVSSKTTFGIISDPSVASIAAPVIDHGQQSAEVEDTLTSIQNDKQFDDFMNTGHIDDFDYDGWWGFQLCQDF